MPTAAPIQRLVDLLHPDADVLLNMSRAAAADAVACTIALVDTILRLLEVVYAPLYALFIVGLVAMVLDLRSQPTFPD